MLKAGVDVSGTWAVVRHSPGAEYGGAAGRPYAYGPASGAMAGPVDCDLVTVPARQGLEAVDILRRGGVPRDRGTGAARGVGPVLHDGGCDTLGFLVPAGTADGWDLPGSACTGTPGLDARQEAGEEPPVTGAGWLVPPDTAEAVTDPAALRAALDEAARTIEAVDRCR